MNSDISAISTISTIKILTQNSRNAIHNIPGVIGSGITLSQGEHQLLILVNEEDKNADYAIDQIPQSINNIKINIRTTKPFRSAPNVNSTNNNGITDPYAKHRPIRPGIAISPQSTTDNSISGVFYIATGTLGAIGYGPNGDRIIISNNHVIAMQMFNTGWLGQNIYQPYLSCLNSNKIGNLRAYIPVYNDRDNLLDAAYASIDPNIQIEETDIYGHTIGNSDDPVLNDVVSKCGAITGYSEGTITALDATIHKINSDGTTTQWTNQILADLTGDHGDSGSTMIRKSDGAALGLIFGVNGAGLVVANKARDVERSLGISFGPVPPPPIDGQKYTCGQGGCISDTNGEYNTIQDCLAICSISETPKISYNRCTIVLGAGIAALTGSILLYRHYKRKNVEKQISNVHTSNDTSLTKISQISTLKSENKWKKQ